jgi:hypothetical protein
MSRGIPRAPGMKARQCGHRDGGGSVICDMVSVVVKIFDHPVDNLRYSKRFAGLTWNWVVLSEAGSPGAVQPDLIVVVFDPKSECPNHVKATISGHWQTSVDQVLHCTGTEDRACDWHE